ncbi:MAG: 6-carboxytetrahydropterin synthase QueD [Desulfohalobiaceae bacterium]
MPEPQSIFRLQVSSEFSSSHQLRHYQGKCEALHGHNFTVQAEVEGYELEPDTEILIDFKEIKSLLNSILRELDHKHLNELPTFQNRNPSSENLARYIYAELKQLLQGRTVHLRWVSVSEKDTSRAVYLES